MKGIPQKVYHGIPPRSGQTDNRGEAIVTGGSPQVVFGALNDKLLGKGI